MALQEGRGRDGRHINNESEFVAKESILLVNHFAFGGYSGLC